MCIVVDDADDFVGLEDHKPACTCRPEYAYRKDGTRIDRHRIDPFCAIHGYHYRREIASAFNRSFNRRRYFSNFILHLGPDEDAGLESWAKGYVTDLIRGYFDKDAIIKIVLHPKDGDYHLHVGVGSDIGHVTLAAILNAKSARGRKPRLDLNTAWVDGYLRDRRWNWCAYTLRVEEGWRGDEWVNRRQRRSWRSRADKGERIKAPTFIGKDEWYGADDVVVERAVEPAKVVAAADEMPASNDVGLGWCLVRCLRRKARKWWECWKKATYPASPRIYPFVRGITQDGRAGESASATPPRPQARPPPASAQSPLTSLDIRGHDVLDMNGVFGEDGQFKRAPGEAAACRVEAVERLLAPCAAGRPPSARGRRPPHKPGCAGSADKAQARADGQEGGCVFHGVHAFFAPFFAPLVDHDARNGSRKRGKSRENCDSA